MKLKITFYVMFKLAILVLVAVTSACLFQNNRNEKDTRYFAKITGIISPFMDYNPRGEITVDGRRGRPHYKVTYNSNGEISQIRYFKNGKKSNDSYYGTHRVSHMYYSDSLVRKYFDKNEKKSFTKRHYYGGGNIHEELFLLDGQGAKKEMFLKDTTNKKVSTELGSYRYVWKTKSNKEFIQEQFKKDGSRNFLTEYFPFYKSSIVIDHKGHLYSITNLDTISNMAALNKAAGYAQVRFDFDEYGNENGWSFHALDMGLTNRKKVSATEYGYAKVAYDFKWKNRKLGLYKSFTMKFLGPGLNPILSNDGIHCTKYEFDDDDNLFGISYFDDKKQRKLHPKLGYHKLKILYDKEGNQKGTIRWDSNGKALE